MTALPLAWGAKVSSDFACRVRGIAATLGCEPSDLMACMAQETGETFSPSVRNQAGSGAVGLIQFMPQTAGALGTSTAALSKMSAADQLDFVLAYLRPFSGRINSVCDAYMAILWPAAVGKRDGTVLFSRADPDHPRTYMQNRGLDWNADGLVTRGEACRPVVMKLARGLRDGCVLPASSSAASGHDASAAAVAGPGAHA